MAKKLIILLIAMIYPIISFAEEISSAKEIRCGWLIRPVPDVYMLFDKDGKWDITELNSRFSASGVNKLKKNRKPYACTCMNVDTYSNSDGTTEKLHYITKIHTVSYKNDRECSSDPQLKISHIVNAKEITPVDNDPRVHYNKKVFSGISIEDGKGMRPIMVRLWKVEKGFGALMIDYYQSNSMISRKCYYDQDNDTAKCLNYYHNGHLLSEENYKGEHSTGFFKQYAPGGHLERLQKYNDNGEAETLLDERPRWMQLLSEIL